MRWVTYFPNFQSVHLTKDVGLIPFYAEKRGYDSSLVGRYQSPLRLPQEVEGLKIENLPDEGSIFFLDRAFLNWLKQNAKEVDVLHLFHLTRDSIVYGAYFKKLNPQGKLYLKMDVYNEHINTRKVYSKNWAKNRLIKGVENRFFKGLDALSVENIAALELMNSVFPEVRDKTFYMPNGVNDLHLSEVSKMPQAKENIILSVGRLGNDVKNYELFLDALPKLADLDWKFVIVGPIDPDFQVKIDRLFEEHLKCREMVVFTGQMSDRRKLYELYAKAKVFFLPSRRESFGIAFVEALYFGCALVGHQLMYAYDDISNHGQFGVYFDDNVRDSFAEAIRNAIDLSESDNFVQTAMNHCQEHFLWSKLIDTLLKNLNNG